MSSTPDRDTVQPPPAASTTASSTNLTAQASYSRSSSTSTLFEAAATASTSADPQSPAVSQLTATSDVVIAGGANKPGPGALVKPQPKQSQTGARKGKSYFTTQFKDESGNKATLLIRNREIWLGNQARVHMIYTVSAISSAIIFAILITDIVREAVDTDVVTKDGYCFRGKHTWLVPLRLRWL